MIFEVGEKGSKKFYEEVVNVTSQYQRLIKKPEAKLNNNFSSMRIAAIALIVLFAVNLVVGFNYGFDTVRIIAMVLVAVAFFLEIFILRNMRKMVDRYLSDDRPSTVTLDENGVELNKKGAQIVRLAWDNVAFVRSFAESTCFLSKDIGGLVICVINKYRQEIVDYIEKNNIDVRVIS